MTTTMSAAVGALFVQSVGITQKKCAEFVAAMRPKKNFEKQDMSPGKEDSQ